MPKSKEHGARQYELPLETPSLKPVETPVESSEDLDAKIATKQYLKIVFPESLEDSEGVKSKIAVNIFGRDLRTKPAIPK